MFFHLYGQLYSRSTDNSKYNSKIDIVVTCRFDLRIDVFNTLFEACGIVSHLLFIYFYINGLYVSFFFRKECPSESNLLHKMVTLS